MNTILGCDTEIAKRRFKLHIICVSLGGAAVLLANILLAVFANENTKVAFTIVNAVIDVLYFWYVFADCKLYLLSQTRKLNLVNEARIRMQGKITEIGKGEHYFGFDCIDVVLENSERRQRVYFIKDCLQIKFEIDKVLFVEIANGIAVTWEEV